MAKTTVLSLLVITCSLMAASLSQDSAFSLYGGHHREVIPEDEQHSVNIHMQFRTVQDSGVLLITTLSTSSDYVAVYLLSDQLQVVLSMAGEVTILSAAAFSNESALLDWQDLNLSLVNDTLSVSLQEVSFLQHAFPSSVSVTSVLFAGPHSFAEQSYRELPVPHYFVGCLSDISLNSRAVQLSGEGVSEGCCVTPRYPMWCLQHNLTQLTLTSAPVSADTLRLSFRLQRHSAGDGLVVAGHSLSTMWALQLQEDHLHVVVNVSGQVQTTPCPGVISLSDMWHQVQLLLESDRVECTVDGIVAETAAATGYASSLDSGQLHLGGSFGFRGCFQRLRLNDMDVGVAMLSDTSTSLGDAPSGPSPVSGELPAVLWAALTLSSSELLLTRGSHSYLTPDNILVHLPPDKFADDLMSRYQLELENAVHFQVLSGPEQGHMFLAHTTNMAQEFALSDILSSDPAHQVGYVHSAGDSLSDEVLFRVWAGCGETVLAELGHLTLSISLEEPDEGPSVLQSEELHLAVGTRRVLTPQMLTVRDSSSPDPDRIVFDVQSVTLLDGCVSCVGVACAECDTEEGGIIIKNGISKSKFFNQQEINGGNISFQHFERFSTAPMLIHLGVSVPSALGNVNLDVTITVSPYPGHINLTTTSPTSCLFVLEGDMALVKSSHLLAVTDFSDQHPVLTYDLLTLPLYGVLQRYESSVSAWVEVSNATVNPFGGTSSSTFTQADIDQGHVRYIHTETYGHNIEGFKFHLRSYNLSGPTGELCIDIVPDYLAPQPTIDVELADLLVLEGGSAAVNRSVLNTSLSIEEFRYELEDPNPTVDLQDLEVIFTLVDPPTYGDLELRGVILEAGDMFTYSDVTSNALIYIHDDSEVHHDQFTFYAEAGSTAYLPIKAPNLTSNLTLAITVTPVNDHTPVMVVDELESIRPPEGWYVDVTPSNINVTDADRPPERLQIYARKKGDTPNGIFAFRDKPEEPILRFTMDDVRNNRVIFIHTLNLSASLNYTQILKIDDGHVDHVIRRPVTITAIPLALSVLFLSDLPCVATLDAAASAPLTYHLDPPSLFAPSLTDHYGNNPNLVADIKVVGIQFPRHGQLLLASDDQSNFTVFSHVPFRQLNRVQYILNEQSWNETSDEFTLQFQYGHSTPVELELRLCIDPVLFPISMVLSSLQVMMGGVAHLSPEQLSVTSSREHDKGQLVFHILTPPQHGSLMNEHSESMSDPLTQFSHADMNTGAIVYEHHSDSTHTADSVVLEVCSEQLCLPQYTLHIEIHPINLTVRNSSIHIQEGDLYQFKVADFEVSAPPDYKLTFLPAVQGPEHGELLLFFIDTYRPVNHFTLDQIQQGRLYYNNSQQEHLRDMFEVSVVATNEKSQDELQLDFLVKIEIEPVNNHDPEIIASVDLTVIRSGSALITSDILSAHDSDVGTNDEDLLWTIEDLLPFHGEMYLRDDPGTRVQSWTEGDISNNRLYYRHTDTEYSEEVVDVLIFEVSDGQRFTSGHIVIRIVLVNFQNYSGLSSFSVEEGASGAITYQHLRYFAANTDSVSDSDISLTISRLPQHGTLSLAGSQLHLHSNFKQSQINSSQLIYQHDHSNTRQDSFSFELSHKTNSITQNFSIFVEPLDDDPPVVILSNPMFVVELNEVRITEDILNIVDEDSTTKVQKDMIVCQLQQPLARGRLEKFRFERQHNHTENFTKFDVDSGNLLYRHLSTPDLGQDQLVFNITDSVNKQPEIYNLTIIVLPKQLTLKLNRLAVTENEMVSFSHEEIRVTHPFLSTVEGVITLRNDSGPYHGELISVRPGNTTHDVRTFTTEDVANGYIAYNHSGDESLLDSFQFQYEARDPAGYNRKSDYHTLYIDIAPVNDQQPILARNRSTLQLFATDSVILDEHHFNVTDYDTEPNKLNFTFQISNLGGYVAYSNDTSTPIHWFTQADVSALRVKFVHTAGPDGNFTYNVTDGVHTASGLITIFADTLALECVSSQWLGIQVEFLSSAQVNTNNLECSFSDANNEREVTFRLSSSQLGHFEVDSEVRNIFTSTEIAAGLVTYVHRETGYWLDTETLQLSVSSPPALPLDGLPLRVSVQYPQPSQHSRLAVNTGLNISEGGRQCINESTLDARNLRYAAWMGLNRLKSDAIQPVNLTVLYNVTEGPHNGVLTLSDQPTSVFTQTDLAQGTLHYSHDDSENLADKLLMNVSVLSENGTVLLQSEREELVVSVSPRNDQPPRLTVRMLEQTLVEGFSVQLSATELSVADNDTSPHQLSFTLHSLPNNTDLMLNSSLLSVNSTFTQQAIDQGWITLRPLLVGTSKFSFTFTDGVHTSPEVEFILTVEKHYLEPVNFNPVTYLQNETRGTVLTTEHLNTSTNGFRYQTSFTVQSPPSYGRVLLSGEEVSDFSQLDVDQGLVSYMPFRGAQQYQDRFSVLVRNGQCSFTRDVFVQILAYGQTSTTSSLDFNLHPDQLFQPLHPEVLVLTELERQVSHPPTIRLLKQPIFGHLERRVQLPEVTGISKRSGEIDRFRYDELQHGWIMYVWDYPEPLENLSVVETFPVVVLADGLQPGQANISFIVMPPRDYTALPPTQPATPPTLVSASTEGVVVSTLAASGFPVYTLVPIVGILLFLIVLILIVVVFCLSQQKKIKKKWVPSLSQQPRHPSPTPWTTHGPPVPLQVTHYEFDPSAMPPGEDHHNSDTSSGFSEPECSPRHTPICSAYSPQPFDPSYQPHPPRSRMRSNVSITFSSRHSTTSEMSLEEEELHSSVSQYPPHRSSLASPSCLPVRPASHTAFSRAPTAMLDSGITSLTSRTLEHSSHELMSERGLPHPDTSQDKSLSQQDTSLPQHIVSASQELSDWAADHCLPDLNDPKIHQRLFAAHDPVLQKEEYWV